MSLYILYLCCSETRNMTLLLHLRNPCVKPAMDAILKCTHVNVVSWIMYESMHSARQDRKHLHFFYLTDGHCRFGFTHEARLNLSAVISSLIFSDYIFHHFVLMVSNLTFAMFLSFYCCWHIIMNTLFFCFGPKIQMSNVRETGKELELTFQTQTTCIKAQEKLKTTQNWEEHKWTKIQIELTRHILLNVVDGWYVTDCYR